MNLVLLLLVFAATACSKSHTPDPAQGGERSAVAEVLRESMDAGGAKCRSDWVGPPIEATAGRCEAQRRASSRLAMRSKSSGFGILNGVVEVVDAGVATALVFDQRLGVESVDAGLDAGGSDAGLPDAGIGRRGWATDAGATGQGSDASAPPVESMLGWSTASSPQFKGEQCEGVHVYIVSLDVESPRQSTASLALDSSQSGQFLRVGQSIGDYEVIAITDDWTGLHPRVWLQGEQEVCLARSMGNQAREQSANERARTTAQRLENNRRRAAARRRKRRKLRRGRR